MAGAAASGVKTKCVPKLVRWDAERRAGTNMILYIRPDGIWFSTYRVVEDMHYSEAWKGLVGYICPVYI